MAVYQTEQRKMLVDFLIKNSDKQYTIEQLIEEMNKDSVYGCAPGKSTVYRLIQKLVSEGTVKRFVKDNSRHFVYQIVAGESCHTHLHLKCTGCGRIIHMDNAVSENMLRQILTDSMFEVDKEQTVLFGRCSSCTGCSECSKGKCKAEN